MTAKINMQTVILAAGQGLRLRPLTDRIPKALVDINGKPLLAHVLESLPEETTEIIIVVGYLHDHIQRTFGRSWHGKPIRYVIQQTLDGTGGALHLLKQNLEEKFLVVNGDNLYATADLERLIAHPVGMLVQETTDSSPASALVDAQGHFEGLEHHAPAGETKRRVCGAYVLDERFFKYPLATITVHGKTEFSLPHTLIAMSRDIPITLEFATFWQSVGTPQELEAARNQSR